MIGGLEIRELIDWKTNSVELDKQEYGAIDQKKLRGQRELGGRYAVRKLCDEVECRRTGTSRNLLWRYLGVEL